MNTQKKWAQVLAVLAVVTVGAYGEKEVMDSLPGRWEMQGSGPEYSMTLPTDDVWWRSFGDSTLTGLIERGEANNYNLRVAVRRLQMASLQTKRSRSGYYPRIDLNGGWTAMQSSGRTSHQFAETREVDYFSLGASMSWEIDVFGRISSQVKSDKGAEQIARADRDAAMVSMAAEIGKNYVELRLAQGELEVARKQMDTQREILHITEVRKNTGLSSGLDVSQATTVLLTTEATMPALEGNVRSCINNIAVLVGEYPGSMAGELSQVRSIPSVSHGLAVGVPADMLRRRPDIVEAEGKIAQAAAAVGIAKKDWLPTLSLTGSIGTSASSFDKLFSGHSYAWQVTPQLSWTLFDGFARKYENASAKLALENSIDEYNQALVSAYGEVENAMSDYMAAVQQISAEQKLLEQAQETFRLSLDLYKQGLSQFSDVMNAQISWLNTENSLLSAKAQASISIISLYEALGGGFVTEQ